MRGKRRSKPAASASVGSSPELGPTRLVMSRVKISRAAPDVHSTSEQASVSDLDDGGDSSTESDGSLPPLTLSVPATPGRSASVLRAKPTPGSHSIASHFLDAHSQLDKYFPRHVSPSPRRRAPSPQPSLNEPSSPASASFPSSPRTFASMQRAGGRRFRLDVLSEVSLLTFVMGLACHRIASLPISNIFPPAAPLIVITILMPFMTLFRRSAPSTHLMVPFTDERGYRDRASADDGFPIAVALPILLAAGAVWEGFVSTQNHQYLKFDDIRILPDAWTATRLANVEFNPTTHELAQTLLNARISLLVLTTINIFVLIFHLILARTLLHVNWMPLSNTKRFFGAVALASTVSFFSGGVAALCAHFGHGALFVGSLLAKALMRHPASPYVEPLELTISSYIFQLSLYLISRLARRGFTLGELTVATSAAVSLSLEFWRLARARFLFSSAPSIPKTFRAPTSIIAYQHILILGVFLAGFMLSPLLVVSRHIASKPSRRLKWPHERERNRSFLALGVLIGVTGIVTGLFGGWLAYVFNGFLRTPWSWVLRFTFYGGDGLQGMRGEFTGWKRYKRFAMSCYWLGMAVLAVGGWQTKLVRARRIKMSMHPGERSGVEAIREERKTLVSLDYRRKFFHALTVVMFVPGIALTPAFTSLAFSLAFSVFTFIEYARYFALYPVGGPIHVFFTEFIDNKDSGPVILSHFYLLTGSAGGLWLEGPGIKRYSGVLALGIGDAMASILGKRLGGPKWPGTNKTLTGTMAFIVSIYLAARLIVVLGLCEPFSASRYLFCVTLSGLLEATSTQNDNLVIPIFFWACQSLGQV